MADKLVFNNSLIMPQIIEPGTHNIVLTTKEGKTVTKSLTFSKSEEQVQKEAEQAEELSKLREEELAKKSAETQEQLNKQINEESEKAAEVEETRSVVENSAGASKQTEGGSLFKGYFLYGMISVSALLILALAYVFGIKKLFTSKPKPVNEEKLAGVVTPPDFENVKSPVLEPASTPLEEAPLSNKNREQAQTKSLDLPQKSEEELGFRASKPSKRDNVPKTSSLERDISSLVEYFVSLIKENYDKDQMVKIALNAGWKQEEIKEALKEAKLRLNGAK
ncbi:hypothetical protein FJZ53_03710 [Candidatus Woesearchaeota archaeon]|nr:hypothetical protein [Candidatus Woesearchaeota archaeon]